MKLYYSPGACALATQIVLRELDMPFELVRVDLAAKTTAEGDFWQVNPKGYIPALKLNDGSLLTESAIILQWLADQKPESNLVPKWGSMERYRAMEWLNFIATELHKGIGSLFNKTFTDEVRENVKNRLATRLKVVDEQLAKNPWLWGSTFSIGDAYLFNILRWAPMLKVELAQFKNIMAFMEKAQARPSIRESMKAEGLL